MRTLPYEDEGKGGLINRGRGRWLGSMGPESWVWDEGEGDAEGAQENTVNCEGASTPIPPHALVCLLLEVLVCFARVTGEHTGIWSQCWNCPLSLGCPNHQTVEYKCVLWAAVAGEVLLPGQMVAVGKSLDLFLLTLSVAVLCCSPQSAWEWEGKGSWVQTAFARTQHQRCFPTVIPPRNQGNFMSLRLTPMLQCCVYDTSVFPSLLSLLSFWLTR